MSRISSWFVFHIGQRTRLRIMAFVTIADTGLISYVSTRNLAERWGFGALSWLYPLCLDAVAAVGMDLWMSNSPAKRAAAWLSLTAVSLSLAANVADWLYVGPGAAVLGAVPPLMLAALLLTMHVHGAHQAAVTEHTPGPASTEQAPDGHRSSADTVVDAAMDVGGRPAGDAVVPVPTAGPTAYLDQPHSTEQPYLAVPAEAPAGAAVPVPPQGRQLGQIPVPPRRQRPGKKGPRPTMADAEVVAALRKHEQNHGRLTRRRAMDLFGMGTDRANRLLAQARDEPRDKTDGTADSRVDGRVGPEGRNGIQLDLAMLAARPGDRSEPGA